MSLLTRTTAVIATGALALGLSALPASATVSAAPVATAPVAAAPLATASSGTKISAKASATSFHRGQTAPKVTVTVKKGSKAAKGKVTFYDGKKKIKTVKLKKGKATIRLKSSLTVGKHTIKVKYGKKSDSVKIRVHNSALTVNATAFTISKSDPYGTKLDDAQRAALELRGTVKYKGKAATKGYVDIYLDGKTKGGSTSAAYLAMSSVSNGTFDFGSYWLSKVVAKYPVGTYKFKAFYTAGSAWADYVHSSWITVTVVD